MADSDNNSTIIIVFLCMICVCVMITQSILIFDTWLDYKMKYPDDPAAATTA
jgi:hypothetical protein